MTISNKIFPSNGIHSNYGDNLCRKRTLFCLRSHHTHYKFSIYLLQCYSFNYTVMSYYTKYTNSSTVGSKITSFFLISHCNIQYSTVNSLCRWFDARTKSIYIHFTHDQQGYYVPWAFTCITYTYISHTSPYKDSFICMTLIYISLINIVLVKLITDLQRTTWYSTTLMCEQTTKLFEKTT